MDNRSSLAQRTGHEPARAAGHSRIEAVKAHVLLVEDQDGMRFVLRTVLEASGYDVEAVENGQEALVRMKADAPDVVATDLVMPVLDGLQLARAITDERGERAVPVVLVSERVFDFPDELRLDRYFDAVVLKPVHPTELLNAVSNLLTAR